MTKPAPRHLQSPPSKSELAISTRGLRKTYRNRKGRHVAVAGLDLDVPLGGVHGFLGPNGSGKTTTIRMLLGLIRADAGTMHIFGSEIPKHLPEVVDRVGAIVESPRFLRPLNAGKNLQLLAEAIDRPRNIVDQVLEQSGLGGRGKDKYKTYSLGMKQRLAIAATLLKEPDLLIFDEPTNGLDPAGIREIRNTMRSLGEQGKTVLVSSHILDEVEQVADTVTVSATCSTSSRMWLLTRTVLPCSPSDRIVLRISRMPAGSRPLVGSSKMSRSGSLSSVAAMASRCFMPREYVRYLSLPRSLRAVCSSTWSTMPRGRSMASASSWRFLRPLNAGTVSYTH